MNIKEFLLPDNIKLLPLKENWLRYACMALLAAGYYILHLNYSLWFSFDMMKENVAFLGITLEKTMFFIKDISFAEFTSLTYLLCSAFTGIFVVFFIICIYGLKNFKNSISNVKLPVVLVFAAIITVLFLVNSFVLYKIYSNDGSGFSSSVYGKNVSAQIITLFLTGIVFPVIKEFVFRFTFFQILRAKINFILSAAISSCLSGGIEYGFFNTKVLLITLAGIFLCWLYEKSRNIMLPAAVHSICSFLPVIF